jgi:hypothetical protein
MKGLRSVARSPFRALVKLLTPSGKENANPEARVTFWLAKRPKVERRANINLDWD